MLSSKDYLAQLVQSRALYRAMLQEALSLLPAKGTDKLEPLESFTALATFAKQLNVSRKTLAADMRRLEHFKWVQIDGEVRVLGRRDAEGVYLIADLAAQNATGDPRLVSDLVVPDILRVKAAVKDDTSAHRTGLGRRWTP
jgi:hypothetical protein